MFEIDLLINDPFELESGEVISEMKLRTTIYGKLNADRSNAVLVFHALTGSSRIHEWPTETPAVDPLIHHVPPR